MTSPCLPRRSGPCLFRAAVLFLLVSVVALSSLARNSRYLPKANPARHVSKIIRMEETSGPRISKPETSGWIFAIVRRRIPLWHPVAFLSLEPPPITVSATLGAELLRSPPVILS